MKRLFKFFMIGAVSAALLSTTSCSKTCDPGYEGNDCKTLANAKFLGTYSEKDTTNGIPYGAFQTTITSGTSADKISIKNLANYECLNTSGTAVDYYVEATVAEKNITISNTACKTAFAGGGTLASDGKIYLDFTATYDSSGVSKTDHIKTALYK